MAKLKLDENLGRRCFEIFKEAGHDVSTVFEQGLCSVPDADILSACRRESRCLVTLDLDFSNPFIFKPSQYSGIAVLRLPSKPSFPDLLDAIRVLVVGLSKEEILGKLWIVQKAGIREYQPLEE